MQLYLRDLAIGAVGSPAVLTTLYTERYQGLLRDDFGVAGTLTCAPVQARREADCEEHQRVAGLLADGVAGMVALFQQGGCTGR